MCLALFDVETGYFFEGECTQAHIDLSVLDMVNICQSTYETFQNSRLQQLRTEQAEWMMDTHVKAIDTPELIPRPIMCRPDWGERLAQCSLPFDRFQSTYSIIKMHPVVMNKLVKARMMPQWKIDAANTPEERMIKDVIKKMEVNDEFFVMELCELISPEDVLVDLMVGCD